MLKKIFKPLCLALLLGLASESFEAQAQTSKMPLERVHLLSTGGLRLNPGETKTLNIDGYRHLKKIHIEAWGVRNEAMFEVLVNGEVKGTIFVPARDPEYVVTIAEAARSIQLRHKTGATVAIDSLVAYQSTHEVRDPRTEFGSGSFGNRNFAAAITRDIIVQVDRLMELTRYEEGQTYLVPVKVAAGRAWSISQARGDTSTRVYQELLNLLGQMSFADAYIDIALRDPARFEDAVEFLALKERLEDAMR